MQSDTTIHGAARWQLDPKEQLDALADQPDAQWVSTQPPLKDPVAWIELGSSIPVEVGGRYDSPQRRDYEEGVLQAILALPEVLQIIHSVRHTHKGGSKSRLEVCLKGDAAARAAAERMMEGGVLQVAGLKLRVRYATGRQPSGTVRVMVLGMPGVYARQGLVEALLTCAGYMAGTGMVVAEFFGELCLGGVPYPGIGRGDMIVAFIKAPSDDQLLRDLPDTVLLQGCTVRLAVEGREGLAGRVTGYVPVSHMQTALQGRGGGGPAAGALLVPPPPPPRVAAGAGGPALPAAAATTGGGVGGDSVHFRRPPAVTAYALNTSTRMEGIEHSSPAGMHPQQVASQGAPIGAAPWHFPPPPPVRGELPASMLGQTGPARPGLQPTASVRMEGMVTGSPSGLHAAALPGVVSMRFPPPPPLQPEQGPTAPAGAGASGVSSLRAGVWGGAGAAEAPERPAGGSSSEVTGSVPGSMPPGPWDVGTGGMGVSAVPPPLFEPPGVYGTWLMTTKFAGAMAEAIQEFATDQAEKDRVLREFFDLYEARLRRRGAVDPPKPADLPGFARQWLQHRFQVPEYPCSGDDAEQPVHTPAGKSRGRKGRRGQGRGREGAQQRKGHAEEVDASRERSRSAGVSPTPSVDRGSTCPDLTSGLRRSARQSKPPDPTSMYSSRVAGGTG
jgi:hypothetical protein